MKISVAIIGRSELMYNTILLLKKNNIEIKYVVTAKEAPEYKYASKDFHNFCDINKLGFLHTSNLSVSDIETLENTWGKADIGISVNYSGVISQKVIDEFPLGILNAHGGDLPRYRGNACMAWAIINCERRVGLCIHKMIGGELDSGPIIMREYKEITINSRVQELFSWMEERIPYLFLESVIAINKDPGYFIEIQSLDPNKALRCYPRNPNDSRIDWTQSNDTILRLINASSEPFSGTFCKYQDKVLIIWRAELYKDDEVYLAVPGQVALIDKTKKYIVVICGAGKLKITEAQFEGQRTYPTEFIKSIRHRLT